ncbi:MAG: GTP-binding protein YchF [Chlamydiales bacterium]|jgi:GTP-binding protein YchF|nr:GTP-binding protein YchF [Chlamydiales bacterium]
MAGLSCGIVGLPNVGKSSLFNALTSQGAASSNYPFCTIEPNVGIVDVLDSRLQVLSELSKSQNIIYAFMRFVDIAGLVAGASQGEGLGNQFLAHIRQVDTIAHVVRCFADSDIIHVKGEVNPIDDIEVINLELILSDLQMADNILTKLEKQARGKKELAQDVECFKKVKAHLDSSLPVRSLELSPEEKAILENYPFLTNKKVVYVANVGEEDLPHLRNQWVEMVEEYAQKEGCPVLPICAKLEAEIAELSKEEKGQFLNEMGLTQSGLDRLIHAAFKRLDMITFLTTGDIETRAWTIERGTKAPQAAGKIHSDIEKGFIRAEVIAFDDMVAYKGRVGAKEAGKARFEGKEYVVKDGDVIQFFHN